MDTRKTYVAGSRVQSIVPGGGGLNLRTPSRQPVPSKSGPSGIVSVIRYA